MSNNLMLNIRRNPMVIDTVPIREDRREELLDWVKSVGGDPHEVLPTIAIRTGSTEYELHLSRFRRLDGKIWYDEAQRKPVTEPVIILLGATPTWPSWLDDAASA